jgi:hypothetical protein
MTDAEWDALDEAALERAFNLMIGNPERHDQIIAMLANGRPKREVQEFCAYLCQMSSLSLPPWADPPVHSGYGDANADRLADLLEDSGVSRYEPSPAEALGAAKRKRLRVVST